jgi:hypothetical protein
MNGMRTFVVTKLFWLYFRHTLCRTDARAVIPMAALFALKPDIFSFALLSHKTYPRYAGSLI